MKLDLKIFSTQVLKVFNIKQVCGSKVPLGVGIMLSSKIPIGLENFLFKKGAKFTQS